MNKSEQLIACLEGEIAKRDEELAACRVAVENCEVFRARIVELEANYGTSNKLYRSVAKEREQHAQRIGELETALEFACKSLAQVTSSDGSGHADIAVSVLRMAGRKEIDASQIVEAYKAGAKWRIDAALSSGKKGE